ncbi:hypothetical protein CRE_13763 [Caenorhabditis remanei]|uniref:Uncharacterized protein n=1 Tax=Caenorhabditis remanei TaxID=31234 RepID=E3NIN0_CAERE|nr:hypothetical protein CRE_13763 [Caenorhabditis remanei]
MEIQQDAWMSKKPTEHNAQITATLTPTQFLFQPVVEIQSLNNQEPLNVNQILSEMTAVSSSLRSVVHGVANHWIQFVMADSSRRHYSTSVRPQAPQISLPTRFINAPLGLIINNIVISGNSAGTDVETEISLLFKGHLTHIFNTARYNYKSASIADK